MPVFFLVGGYANGISWQSARQRGTTYGGWLRGRTRRLSFPVVPVVLFWFAFGWVALRLGMTPDMLRTASTGALVPTWFLASYILVVAVAPLGVLAWQRWGWWSVVAVNARIMTRYLWHVTAMVRIIGVSAVLGGPGLHLEPLSGPWWLARAPPGTPYPLSPRSR